MLFPAICALCGRIGEPAICGYCRTDLGPIRPNLLDGSGPVAYRAVLFDYQGRAKQAVHQLKYNRQTVLGAPLSTVIAEAVDLYQLGFDIAVPIPIHYLRRCFRGFNQAEILAEGLNAERVFPHALKRVRYTRPQATLSRDQRLANLTNAFRARSFVRGHHVLLVDDVATTGGTAIAAAEALLSAGAAGVGLIALAGNP